MSTRPSRFNSLSFLTRTSRLWQAVRLPVMMVSALCLTAARAQIFVGDNGVGTGGVAIFAQGANGDVLPDALVAGLDTGIVNIRGVAANSTDLFVLCDNNLGDPPFVLRYGRPTSGNVAPASLTYLAPRAGASFGTYAFVGGLAADATHLYVLDSGASGPGLSPGAVNVYPVASLVANLPGSPLAATRTIDGPNATTTQLALPTGIAVDAEFIYVANNAGNNLLIFDIEADGNVAPARTITGLSLPSDVAVDATTIYAYNFDIFSEDFRVTTYPVDTPGGAVAPVTTLRSAAFDFNGFQIAVDANNVYVGNSPSVLVFPKDADGADVAPTATISGANALFAVNALAVIPPPGTAAPTVTASGGSTAFTSGGGAVVVDGALTLTAVPATLATATIQITGGLQPAEDVLAFANDDAPAFGNIAGIYNPAIGALQLVSEGATAT